MLHSRNDTLNPPGWILNIGEINWNDFDDLNVQQLLPEMEGLLENLRREMDRSGVTHRDIAL